MLGLGMLLNSAAGHLKREFERASRPYGLTLLQWRALSTLSRTQGQTQTELAATLEASPMTVSNMLERLEAAGLVSRETDQTDSRAKRVAITAKARSILAQMRVTAEAVYARAARDISDADQQALMRALQQIIANLETPAAAPKEDE